MDPSSQRRRSQFRPCIDLHGGVVKQIVGGTLTDDGATLQTNFVSRYMLSMPANAMFARGSQLNSDCTHRSVNHQKSLPSCIGNTTSLAVTSSNSVLATTQLPEKR
jgi:hypothetical protein